MERRDFITTATLAASAAAAGPRALFGAEEDLSGRRIPRWRGFNLQGRFPWPGHPSDGPAYQELDFEAMAEWGFDFARLPLNYWSWGSREDWTQLREAPLEQIDRAIELGRKHKVHVNLNFHRVPGYCVNGRELEPADLFSGRAAERQRAQDAAVFHWKAFARRYRGIPNRELSFDLINEPPKMRPWEGYLEERYVEVVKALVAGIREVDPGRLIVADGLDIGQLPVPALAELGIAQSTRGYLPKAVSHYTASWVPREEFESFAVPTWPLKDDKGSLWDRARLKKECIDPWLALAAKGVPIHVGEFGAFTKTPHAVVLAWLEDFLSLWQEAGWGFAMWELRGAFGVLDSKRPDVVYEDWRGHKLDRRLLELLRRY